MTKAEIREVNIKDFAEKHRLTVRRDSCNEAIILGRPRNAIRNEDRNHIYEHDDTTLGICLLMGSVGKWNNRKKAAVAAGFTLGQDGTGEGTLLFDPEHAKQSRLAIKLVGAREKRVLTPEEAAVLKARGQRLAGLRQAQAKQA